LSELADTQVVVEDAMVEQREYEQEHKVCATTRGNYDGLDVGVEWVAALDSAPQRRGDVAGGGPDSVDGGVTIYV
jgi:hypothetical protein